MEVDCRGDLIGGRINAIKFVVSRSRDPDGAEGDDNAGTAGWQGNRRLLGTILSGIPPQLIACCVRPTPPVERGDPEFFVTI
jgi:hypothetical protein